jgi:hypothetical protein
VSISSSNTKPATWRRWVVGAIDNAIAGVVEGTAVLSTGEGGGVKVLREDGDGTSSWQAIPAHEGTTVLSTGEGGGSKFLREDGDGTSSWQAPAATVVEGTAILSTGEAGGSKYLREDGDGTSSWQAVSIPAHEGTSVLSTGEGGGTKYLREDGDGTSSWQVGTAGGSYIFVIKSATEEVTSSTTLQDDDELTVTLVANTQYAFEYYVIPDSISATPGFKYKWVAPGTTAAEIMERDLHGVTFTLTSGWTQFANDEEQSHALTSNEPGVMVGHGHIDTDGTGGTFKLQWAQISSNGSATKVKKGSWMRLTSA